VFPRYFARVSNRLTNYSPFPLQCLIEVVVGIHGQSWPRSEPTRTASAGGLLRALNRPARGSPRDLAIGIDAGEIDGPGWSVSGRGTAGALDRVAQIPARPFRLGLTRVL